jgi:hypothetical protein
MVVVAIVGVAFLTGCGQSKEGNAVVGNADPPASKKPAVVVDDPMPEENGSLPGNLKKTSIAVSPKGAKANIHDFARAFCGKYGSYEPNKKILKYLAAPKSYKKYDEMYEVVSDVSNGYISSILLTEIDRFTKMCYWNRKNGHQLVGVTMERGMEGEGMTCQYMFYDYDKTTGRMTPDMNVVKVFDKLAASYEDIVLYLPEEGKDIVVYAFNYGDDEESEDDDTLDSYSGKWDGTSFSIVKE